MSGKEHFVEMDVRDGEAYELAKEWFDDVVFTTKLTLKDEPDWERLKEDVRELRKEYGKVAVLVSTRKPSLIREIKRRNLPVLLYVQGGDMRINRYALESGVDALISPWLGRRDPGFDHVLARIAARRGVAIGFSLAPVLNAGQYERAMLLRFMGKVWRLVEKYGAPRFLTSSAENRWEVRSPRDLMSLGLAIGMDAPRARASLDFHPRAVLRRLR
ncbi:MAG: Ribonuclease P protein component 3 [Thermococci archaeon]|nr:Ribonuclease P protein component 3 [Thermococci archaeon]